MSITITDFQKRATALSHARDNLSSLFLALQADLDAVKAKHYSGIRAAARAVATHQGNLQQLIQEYPESFRSPRTYVVEGIRFGLRASNGAVEWDDDEKVCLRIRRAVEAGHLTEEQADLCISTTMKPVAAAVAKLEPALRTRIGVRIEGAGDVPTIKSVDSDIEKAVNTVIKAAIKEAEVSA